MLQHISILRSDFPSYVFRVFKVDAAHDTSTERWMFNHLRKPSTKPSRNPTWASIRREMTEEAEFANGTTNGYFRWFNHLGKPLEKCEKNAIWVSIGSWLVREV